MEKKIKVAQIIGHMENGGIEAVVFDYFKFIDKTKFDFTFFVEKVSSEIINKETIETLGGKIIYLPPIKKLFSFKKTLKEELKKGCYDIAHVHMNTLNVFGLKAAKEANVPIRISHSHATSSRKEITRHAVKLFLRLFSHKHGTHFVACSKEAGYFQFGKKYVNSGKVKILSNAIDIKRFAFNESVRKQMREELKCENKFVIGDVGRLVQTKNQLFLLEVFSRFHQKHPNSVLLLIGSGNKKEEMLLKAKKLNVLNSVICVGGVNNIEDYYQAMDVFTMPSLFEGFGLAALEAQANGLPCLLSSFIPKEVVVNETTIQLKLKHELWADYLDKFYTIKTRKSAINPTHFHKFDIRHIVEELANLYLNCYLNHEGKTK